MIKLIKSYPYDNNYDYIKLHSSKAEQQNYFSKFDNIKIDEGEDEGYIREGESFIVDYNYDWLVAEGVNYVIWNNGYKDLYCFIIRKEYVDEECTRLYYEIDVLNTYLFDISLNNSFVERKECAISEITDFDESLNIGEHTIVDEVATIEKEYIYVAMLNGIKEQVLRFDTNNNLLNVVQLPGECEVIQTYVDGIPYPINFVELHADYPEPVKVKDLDLGGSTGVPGGNQGDISNMLSPEGFRFIKGFEGFAPNPYQDASGYWTICYGVTLHGEPDLYNELEAQAPVSEEIGARASYNLKNERYASAIYERCLELGLTKQYQFDALVSLAYNAGNGVILNNNSLTNIIASSINDENAVREVWESFYTSSGGVELPGLVARRKDECNMFFNKTFENRSIALIDSSGNISGTVTENNGNGWLPS